MKKYKVFILIIIFGLIMSACAVSPNEQSASIGTSQQSVSPRTIEVTGEATKQMAPDIATLTLGVQTTAKNAAAAEDQNSEIMSLIFDELDKLQIDSSDIQTSNFYVYQNYSYDNDGNRTSTHYYVSNSIRVIVRDLDKLSTVISTVLEYGANDIQGITFDLSDREAVYAEVLEQAIKNGMNRADVMAMAINEELGVVQTISSSIYGGGYTVGRDAVMSEMGMGGGGGTPISSGEINISVTVIMVVNIK